MSVKMKRIFAIVLFATMVLTMLPFGSFAEPNDFPVYIGNVGYNTLTAAIEAVEEGADTVTNIRVVADTTVSATSSESDTVLLDRKKIRVYSEGSPVITVNAPFKLSNPDTDIVFENLNLQYNGTVDMFEIAYGSLTVQGKNSKYTCKQLTDNANIFHLVNKISSDEEKILGEGRLTVNGGTFESSDRFITVDDKSECIIYDATVTAEARILTGDRESNTTIHGGSFKGTQIYCLNASNTTVTGGTFELSHQNAFLLDGNAHASIYGGMFKSTNASSKIGAGYYTFVLNGAASATIYDGTFKAPNYETTKYGTACSIAPEEKHANAVLAIFGGTFYSGANAIRGGEGKGNYYIYGGTFYLTSGQKDSKLTSNTGGYNNLVPSQALDGLEGEAFNQTIDGVTYTGKVALNYQADKDTSAIKFKHPTSNTEFGVGNADNFVKFSCDGTVITSLSADVKVSNKDVIASAGSVKLWNATTHSFKLGDTEVAKLELDNGTLFLKNQTYGQTKPGTTGSADLRFVSAFTGNCDDYQTVGYLISLSAVNVLPDAFAASELKADALYRSVIAAGETISAPEGSLWLALGINNIPESAFPSPIYIRAYAVKTDGTVVIGEIMTITAGDLM